jgi:hypothetical protein
MKGTHLFRGILTAFAISLVGACADSCDTKYAQKRMNNEELRAFEAEQQAKLNERREDLAWDKETRGEDAKDKIAEERDELSEKRVEESDEAAEKLNELAEHIERDSPTPVQNRE